MFLDHVFPLLSSTATNDQIEADSSSSAWLQTLLCALRGTIKGNRKGVQSVTQGPWNKCVAPDCTSNEALQQMELIEIFFW